MQSPRQVTRSVQMPSAKSQPNYTWQAIEFNGTEMHRASSKVMLSVMPGDHVLQDIKSLQNQEKPAALESPAGKPSCNMSALPALLLFFSRPTFPKASKASNDTHLFTMYEKNTQHPVNYLIGFFQLHIIRCSPSQLPPACQRHKATPQ